MRLWLFNGVQKLNDKSNFDAMVRKMVKYVNLGYFHERGSADILNWQVPNFFEALSKYSLTPCNPQITKFLL